MPFPNTHCIFVGLIKLVWSLPSEAKSEDTVTFGRGINIFIFDGFKAELVRPSLVILKSHTMLSSFPGGLGDGPQGPKRMPLTYAPRPQVT